MSANFYNSYDCPYNKTALHYASENGHVETVNIINITRRNDLTGITENSYCCTKARKLQIDKIV